MNLNIKDLSDNLNAHKAKGQDHWPYARIMLEGMVEASHYHLHHEVLDSTLARLGTTEELAEAVAAALYEWDV